jgi:hypothetical protein
VSDADEAINCFSHSHKGRLPMRSADVAKAVHPWYPRHLLFRVVQMLLRLATVHTKNSYIYTFYLAFRWPLYALPGRLPL